ncbi:MAG: serine/threonine protein kinase [Myxococcaceae bacterium]|nr:serine/threonine protein kinase [Myxococcaceae bacterium]
MGQLLESTNPEGPAAPLAFGVYRVERALGSGAMGQVYRARHEVLGRQVAIKCLHPSLVSDEQLVKRFLQEARLVNAINHPHIVEVYDFVEAPGQVYAVMELLTGETLTDRLKAGGLTLSSLLGIVRQIGEALRAAHALSVVHRDLKPDNVFLVKRDGRDWVKVLDFGIAKLVSTDGLRVVETQNGSVLGTPRYMAPEQAAGLDVDARTDIYAFGVVLYELLSGQVPFDATSFGQLASAIITRPPPPLPKTTPAGEPIPEALRALAASCLSKQPEERPQTMDEVLGRLPTDEAKATPGSKRTPIAAVAALVVAAVAGVAALVLGLRPEARPAEPAPPSTSILAPVVVPPTPPPPSAPADVKLSLQTVPTGAEVVEAATGALLGVTPLTLERPPGAPLTLRFELKGYEPLTREVPTSESLRVELPLSKKLPPLKPPKPVKTNKDGVLDPF